MIKKWIQHVTRHRDDAPAVERAKVDKFWFQDGKFHRPDGPAIEWANGSKEWYLNGQLHREGGPAVEHANGNTEYWINGIKQEVAIRTECKDEFGFLHKKVVFTNLPTGFWPIGEKEYWVNGIKEFIEYTEVDDAPFV